MDIRTMQYYLAVVREGTISAAAQALHVAQPSLSRQMKELEEELGVSLFVRGNRKITLTEEGMVLRKRAEEMVRLMQMTEEEISQIKNHISGSVRIGAGESWSFHYLSRAAASIAAEHPDIRFHITSGDTQDLMDELNNGLIDFAVIFTSVNHTLYQSIELPVQDSFGVLMPKDCPLAEKSEIRLSDLKGLPVIISRAAVPYYTGSEEMIRHLLRQADQHDRGQPALHAADRARHKVSRLPDLEEVPGVLPGRADVHRPGPREQSTSGVEQSTSGVVCRQV